MSQGHSVQNTSLESSLCTVKLPMLLTLPPQSQETRMGPALFARLAMQVAGRLFIHHLLSNARPSLHTHRPHIHTHGDTLLFLS